MEKEHLNNQFIDSSERLWLSGRPVERSVWVCVCVCVSVCVCVCVSDGCLVNILVYFVHNVYKTPKVLNILSRKERPIHFACLVLWRRNGSGGVEIGLCFVPAALSFTLRWGEVIDRLSVSQCTSGVSGTVISTPILPLHHHNAPLHCCHTSCAHLFTRRLPSSSPKRVRAIEREKTRYQMLKQ